VAFPQPVPGLVIHYSYLWNREHLQGLEEGRKDRPCAVVAAIRSEAGGETRVLVLPVTHRAPDDPSHAIEIPALVKRRLGLDDAPSWVTVTEWNEFLWPGPDLRFAPAKGDTSAAYGMLPPGLFAAIREAFLNLAKKKLATPVRRT
jgi:hypothetical protein